MNIKGSQINILPYSFHGWLYDVLLLNTILRSPDGGYFGIELEKWVKNYLKVNLKGQAKILGKTH